MKPLKHRFWPKAKVELQERKQDWETGLRSSERTKALKGEPQERWRLKYVVEALEAKSRRKGNQTLRTEPLRDRANSLRRVVKRPLEKRGLLYRICCRAEELQRGTVRIADSR
jgi:hypothetical protein